MATKLTHSYNEIFELNLYKETNIYRQEKQEIASTF